MQNYVKMDQNKKFRQEGKKFAKLCKNWTNSAKIVEKGKNLQNM